MLGLIFVSVGGGMGPGPLWDGSEKGGAWRGSGMVGEEESGRKGD
jgi:hypothetical protein